MVAVDCCAEKARAWGNHDCITLVLGRSRRPLVRPCADWTERRPHLGGAVGAAIARHLTEQQWIVRRPGGRGVDITGAGRAALGAVWNIDLPTSP